MDKDRSTLYQVNLDRANSNDVRIIAENFVTPGSTVLDVGSACGDFGVLIKRKKDCSVHGMDVDESSNALAAQTNAYEQIHEVDLDCLTEDSFAAYAGHFDVIALNDVLEHLIDPEKVLAVLVGFLKPDGYLILSLPNVAFFDVKIGLLDNRFDYTDTGILDRTHLKFFTYRSMSKMLAEMGLEIVDAKFKVSLPAVDVPAVPASTVRYVGKDPHSFVYQYVLKVIRSNNSRNRLLESNLVITDVKWPVIRRQIRSLKTDRLARKVFPEKTLRYKAAKKAHKLLKQLLNRR